MPADASVTSEPGAPPHRRRPRYRGRNPRAFHEKYKELQSSLYPETVEKVLASGKTPAGTHRPILVAEVLEVLAPQPGCFAIDCTLGYGGHAEAILQQILPGGHLLGLDVDPIEQPQTTARLRRTGFDEKVFSCRRSNFAGLPAILSALDRRGADVILADLGVSSMQIDNPERGFSMKGEGPLDMRMNPARGLSASDFIRRSEARKLATLFRESADEPLCEELAAQLAGRTFLTTQSLVHAVKTLSGLPADDDTVRRVFQAIRIAINDEFSALEAFLRHLPSCLRPGGRVAILTFHSGEDRRVKHALKQGLRDGLYAAISNEVIRPTAAERRANSRSRSAKMRWAVRQP